MSRSGAPSSPPGGAEKPCPLDPPPSRLAPPAPPAPPNQSFSTSSVAVFLAAIPRLLARVIGTRRRFPPARLLGDCMGFLATVNSVCCSLNRQAPFAQLRE